MTRILCLWLPNWPIQRLLRSRPELKNRPLALVVNGPRGGIVAACSRDAAAQGVSLGQPLAEAQALVRHLAVAPHQPAARPPHTHQAGRGLRAIQPARCARRGRRAGKPAARYHQPRLTSGQRRKLVAQATPSSRSAATAPKPPSPTPSARPGRWHTLLQVLTEERVRMTKSE